MNFIKNKKLLIVVVSLILLVIILSAVFLIGFMGFSKRVCLREKGSVEMIMKDDGFSPQNLKIQKCTKVIFKNEGSKPHWPASDLHPTHLIYPEFDPQEPVEPGNSWSFVFGKAGNWKYHDHLAPLFRGVISVN